MDFGTEATPLATGFFSIYAPDAGAINDEIVENVNIKCNKGLNGDFFHQKSSPVKNS